MSEVTTPRVEDLVPTRSRVSLAPAFAGAVIALASYLLLTLLATAIGLSVGDKMRTETLSAAAGICAIAATMAALFVGGWVTSQTLVGENKCEAVIHGILMWGMVLAMILWLASFGVRSGFNAILGVAHFSQNTTRDTTPEDWEAAARRAGVKSETIADWKGKIAKAPEAAQDPANQKAAVDHAAHVTWWALFGTLLSMGAAIAGALVGAGPTFRLVVRPAGHLRGVVQQQHVVKV